MRLVFLIVLATALVLPIFEAEAAVASSKGGWRFPPRQGRGRHLSIAPVYGSVLAIDVKAQDGSPTVFLPSVSTKGVRYLQLSYGKVNVVSFVKFSQQKSQQLLKSLDGLAMEYAGCVDMVTVNINKWVEKMFFRLTSLDLPHTRLLQDSGKAKLWSTNNVNESDTVLIFSRTMEPLCVLSLNRDFQSNVSDLVSSVRNRVDEILQQQPLESANLSEWQKNILAQLPSWRRVQWRSAPPAVWSWWQKILADQRRISQTQQLVEKWQQFVESWQMTVAWSQSSFAKWEMWFA